MPSLAKKRGRGRPRKDAAQATEKRPRGRPRKYDIPAAKETTTIDTGNVVPIRQECKKLDLSDIQQLPNVHNCNQDEAAVMEKMKDLSALLHEPTVDAFPIQESAVSVRHFTIPSTELNTAVALGNSTVSVRDEPANWNLDRLKNFLGVDKDGDGDGDDEVAVMEKNEFRALISEPTVGVNVAFPNREPLLLESAAVAVAPALSLSPTDSSEKKDDTLVSDSIITRNPRGRGRPRKQVSPESLTGNAVITTERARTQPCERAVTVREEPEDSNKWDLDRLQQVFAEGYDGEVEVMKKDGYELKPEPAMEDLSTLKSSRKNSAGCLISDSVTEKKPRGRPRKRNLPEPATGDAGTAENAVMTEKRPRIPPRKFAETVGEEPKYCNELAPVGNVVTTKKRPRGRPSKIQAVTVSEEPEDCNKLDPARMDEVVHVAMFKANDECGPPVNVTLPHLMSEAQKPSCDSKDDNANGGSAGFAEEVVLMNKHDEVAVTEKVDNYPEPPVNESNAVSSPHVMSGGQMPSSNMKSDFANGDYQEVTVVEKESNVSLPQLMFDQRASSDVNNDLANGGSTGIEVEAEGHQDEVVMMEKVSEYTEPMDFDVNIAIGLPHLMPEVQMLIDISIQDSTRSLPHLMSDERPLSNTNTDISNGTSTGFAVTGYCEAPIDVNNASLPHLTFEDQQPIINDFPWDATWGLPDLMPLGDLTNTDNISTWDYTVSVPHFMCEYQRPSSDFDTDVSNRAPIVDSPDQTVTKFSQDHQRPSSDMNDVPVNASLIVDLPDREYPDNAFPDSVPILINFGNGGSNVGLPDQEAMHIPEDHQRPSSDMNNDFANGGSKVDFIDQEAWGMCEDQRPSRNLNYDIGNGASTVDLPDREAQAATNKAFPDSDPISNDLSTAGAAVGLPDQEATDYAFPDSDPIFGIGGSNVGLPDREVTENAIPVVSLPGDNQNCLEHAEHVCRYETPEVFSVEPFGFVNPATEALNYAPLLLQELPLPVSSNTCDFPLWLTENEDMYNTNIEYPYEEEELSPLWDFEI